MIIVPSRPYTRGFRLVVWVAGWQIVFAGAGGGLTDQCALHCKTNLPRLPRRARRLPEARSSNLRAHYGLPFIYLNPSWQDGGCDFDPVTFTSHSPSQGRK